MVRVFLCPIFPHTVPSALLPTYPLGSSLDNPLFCRTFLYYSTLKWPQLFFTTYLVAVTWPVSYVLLQHFHMCVLFLLLE
jgi:hypothetical protein